MSILTLSEGTLFAGRYRILRCIAQGGMGAVYEVIHLETERRRALKVMLPHLVQSGDLRERFRREARVAAQIESAFIVDVFDAGIDEPTGMPFLVMELLKGEELGKRLARVGRLGPSEVVRYLWQTALALDKTHKAHIVHRDLKPENLFLSEQDDGPPRIKVLDFGIAKIVAENGTQANATRSIGTPLYMAPEQFRPGSQVYPATDIYSLGMMAYTLLVGIPYWEEEQTATGNVFAFVASAMHGPVEPATARAARRGVMLSPGFDAWFARVTASMPEQRFASATAAIMALAEALGLPKPGESSQSFSSPAMLGLGSAASSTGVNGGTVALSPSTHAPQVSTGPGTATGPNGLARSNELPGQTGPRGISGQEAVGAAQTGTGGSGQTGSTGVSGLVTTQAPSPRKSHVALAAAAGGLALLLGAGGLLAFTRTRSAPAVDVQPPLAENAAQAVAMPKLPEPMEPPKETVPAKVEQNTGEQTPPKIENAIAKTNATSAAQPNSHTNPPAPVATVTQNNARPPSTPVQPINRKNLRRRD